MELFDVVEEIHDNLAKHRHASRTFVWATIVKQDSFDSHCFDIILNAICACLEPFDDKRIVALWRGTETGMCNETTDECLFIEYCRMNLKMELLLQIMGLAWEEATGGRPKSQKTNLDDHGPK